jgi:hypothetical protein
LNKKNKKKKRAPSPKLQAPSAIKRTTLDGTEIILKE